MKDPRELKPDKAWANGLMAAGMALALPGTFGAPIFFGYTIDQKYNTTPIGLYVGMFVGFFAAGVEIYLMIKRLSQIK